MSRFLAGAVIAAIVSYLLFDWHEMSRLRPPAEGCSFRAFLTKKASVHEIRTFRWRGEQYLEVIGPIRGGIPVRGSPSYVFNRSGRLVAWTRDKWSLGRSYPGEDHESDVRYLDGLAEALAWLDGEAPEGEPAGP